ncbi:MAG TPA: hypothetical protein VJL56_05915 [Candidatus Bathyarchaeia archaeon]|nr:hypothetical protein [Candidatus Bathyarchaeia archaeon]
MKGNKPIRVVLVDGDSTRLVRPRARAFDTFKTVRFEDRKHEVATKYGVFWSLISRRIL